MLQTASPFSLLLFGASGNLAKLKIYPALYVLALKKRLPKDYAVIGYARTPLNDASFRTLVEESVRADMGEVTEKVLQEFLTHVHYRAGQYDDVSDLRALGQATAEIERGWGKTVRIAYLSVPPQVIPSLLEGLCTAGVHGSEGGFRCIVEKPVGHDLKSFERIREKLLHCLPEEEIYLLDHYLGKEAVRNVYYLRFANPILERLFKNTLIHHVEVSASETVGIEGRAGYFEHTGAFRDMFQSHLLQICALLTMQVKDTESGIPESRKNALKQFYLPPATNLDDIVLQGQYGPATVNGKALKGYREEEGVKPDSRTNTYAALKLLSRESRWQGVPFYLRSGKRLARKETRVSILFQEPRAVGKGSEPNRLDIILQGEAGMRMFLQTKLGGTEPAFRPLVMEDPLVCIGDCLPEHGLLLLEAITGKKHWFLSFDEIRTAWLLTDPLQAYLDTPSSPLYVYPSATAGPAEAHRWMEREGLRWL